MSWQAVFFYIIFFVLLQVGLSVFAQIKPGVLGVSSVVDRADLIGLTNQEREKKGLPVLKEDSRLNEAARKKGENMFEENYWAHYSPTGKDPWGFITKSGYGFLYAGENLARNFYTSEEVVKAWMASSTHRDNILNNHYRDIGIAVLEGVMNGQKTVLVVQEFGSPTEYMARSADGTTSRITQTQTQSTKKTQAIAGVSRPVDPSKIVKSFGFGILALISTLLFVDLLAIKRRMVYRVGPGHLPHWTALAVAISALINMNSGSIL